MKHSPLLASPAFPDDDGRVDPGLQAAFDAVGGGDDAVTLVGALGGVRVFVPIVAMLGQAPADGDKEADMAAVFMTGADGRKALLAFSSLETMTAWDGQSRPVAVFGQAAARAALAEEASALLLDLGGQHFTVIETEDLQHLAAGHQLVRTAAGIAWLTDTPASS